MQLLDKFLKNEVYRLDISRPMGKIISSLTRRYLSLFRYDHNVDSHLRNAGG